MDTEEFHATDIENIFHKIIVEIFPDLMGKILSRCRRYLDFQLMRPGKKKKQLNQLEIKHEEQRKCTESRERNTKSHIKTGLSE